MDHLPLPRNPTRQHPLIPYVVQPQHQYDGKGLLDFPKRMNIDLEALKEADFHDGEWDEIISFLQAWAFFGFIRETIANSGVALQLDEFVSVINGQKFITTKLLPYYLRLWASHANALDETAKERQLNHVDDCLAVMHRYIEILSNAWPTLQKKSGAESQPSLANKRIPSAAQDVLLSVLILAESLSYGRYFCYDHGIVRPFTWPKSTLIDLWLIQNGWCPYEIRWLDNKFTHVNTCSYYLSQMERPSHDINHDACTWEACIIDKMDVSTYQTKHVTDTCTCPDALQDKEIARIKSLVKDNTPVISISEDDDDSQAIRVSISAAILQEPYVAISHVWSDGLGNNNRNSLPRCQLLRLQKAVDNLYTTTERPVFFWIDTLCVPLDPVERKSAILRMKETYQDADKVLVLDSSFSNVSGDSDSIEILMRLMSARWMRRLWTFQEGALSKSLHFQFTNTTLTHGDLKARRLKEWEMHIRNLCKQHQDHLQQTDRSILQIELSRFLKGASEFESSLFFEANHEVQKCRDSLKNITDDGPLFDELVENVKWRTTSKPEDEFLCMSALLRRNIADVISQSYEERMIWLFLSLESIPASIIFHDRPRIEKPGCRWMPISLLNSGSAFSTGKDGRRATPCQDGLVVTFPGLLLTPDPDFYMSESSAALFLVSDDKSRAYAIGPVAQGERGVSSRREYLGQQLAMVFEDFEDRSMENVPMSRAIIVTVMAESEEGILASIEHPAIFLRVSMGAIPPDAVYASAKALPSTQVWQVG